MRARVVGLLVLIAGVVGVGGVEAQTRVVTGRITSAQTGQPVPGASVSVVGTVIVAQSSDRGEYSLAAPTGDLRLLVRAVGCKRRQGTVGADQQKGDVTREQDL